MMVWRPPSDNTLRRYGGALLVVMLVATPLGAQPAHADIATDIRTLSDSALRVWQARESPEGIFPNPQPAEVAKGHTGFAPPMLMYAMQRSGERAGDPNLVAGAERAWPNSVRIERASGFDVIGVSYAYRDLVLSMRARTLLAQYLRAYAIPPNGRTCIARPGCYSNLVLVDALAILVATRSGLRSDVPGSRLADPAASRSYAARVVNERVPQVVDHQVRIRLEGQADTGSLLSDPPRNPLSYHALSTFMLSEALKELGPDGSADAHRALHEGLAALAALVGPDGDVSYMGRGQGQVWVPALTVGAMVNGAALVAPTDPDRAARYLAVAQAAIERLRTQHLSPQGLQVVPGARRTYDGLDSYVHTVAYNGLALFALTVAADVAATLPPIAPATMPARRQLEVADAKASGMGVLSDGRIWIAAHAGAIHPRDMRYDIGLLALARRAADGAWRQLLAPRPQAVGTAVRSSGGPVLSRGSRTFAPFNARLAVRNSRIVITGALRSHGARSRRHTTITYWPNRDGVTASLAPTRGGDNYTVLVFAPQGTGHATRRAVHAAGATWRFPTMIRTRRIAGRYHSGPVENLDAIEVSMRAPKEGALRFTITAS